MITPFMYKMKVKQSRGPTQKNGKRFEMVNKKLRVVVSLAVLFTLGAAGVTAGCTRYVIKDKVVLSDLAYAKPLPGKFRYIKRNVSATAMWDSKESKEEKGSKGYMMRMSSLAVRATKKLLYKVNLQHNQALYNVRISSPRVVDTYFWWFVFIAGLYTESRATVTVTADVIEFI